MTTSDDAIRAFWSLFRERANDLAAADSADAAVYDELLAKLQEIDAGLYLEFCADPENRELIVTAEGKRELFPLARAVVAAAPAVGGWSIVALKPKLGFPETAQWEGLTIQPEAIVFDPLELDGGDLGLRIFVPGIAKQDLERAHNAVLRAIDHGLGEEAFADGVQATEVRLLPADAKPDDFIPLRHLEKYIDWRKRRRPGAD